MKAITALVFALTVSLAVMGCSGDDDSEASIGNCTTLCTSAQAGNCTSIKGDCSAFCSALDATQDAATCTAIRNTYQSCLNAGDDVCANNCDSQEQALIDCMTPYCLQNVSDPSCQTIAGALL